MIESHTIPHQLYAVVADYINSFVDSLIAVYRPNSAMSHF